MAVRGYFRFWIACAAILLVAIAALMWYLYRPKAPMHTVTIGSTLLSVEIASDELARERGLSGRASLPEGQGMLFVFDSDNQAGIWMKDMKFPIDILWADATGTVITIVHDIAPDTYPKSFYPSRPARYVLEVPAGYTQKQGIAEGAKIVVE